MKNDMREKLSLLTELIQMARVDHEVRDIEYRFILSIAKMIGVEKDQLDPLFDQYIEFSPPASEFERILQFHRLILVANIDLGVNSKEIDLLKEFGIRLGLRPAAVENVLIEMTRHENGMIPTDIMIRIFQVYHN